MDTIIIFVGKYLFGISFVLIAYIFLKLNNTRRKELVLLLIGGGLLSLLIAKIGSQLYFNPRPLISDNIIPLFAASDVNGFPSDHTLITAFLGFAALSYSKKLGLIMLVIAALVGWARVAAGVHHFVDVIGAFIFTGAATFVILKVLKYRAKDTSSVK